MFTKKTELRFSDMDMYGHLNHAKYFSIIEAARTELFMDDFLALKEEGILFFVVYVDCTYKKPITLRDELLVEMVFYQISRTRFEGKYRLHDGKGKLYAEATTVLTTFSERLGKSVDIPEIIKNKFIKDDQK